MSVREYVVDYSKGDNLVLFWKLFWLRSRTKSRVVKVLSNFLCSRLAHRHGGYIGNGAQLADIPSLPHGIHGIYISRYASVGEGCRIYQNVTIGEVNGKAPVVEAHCLIGAGAVLLGDIRIGHHARIGAGAVVAEDIPPYATVVPQGMRIIERGET